MKPSRVAVCLTVLFALAAFAQAGEGKKKSKKPSGTRGVVLSVNPTAKSFVFRTGHKKDNTVKETTIQISETTKFTRIGADGPADAKATDLAVKKRVAVTYDTQGNQNVASAVTIIDIPRKKKA